MWRMLPLTVLLCGCTDSTPPSTLELREDMMREGQIFSAPCTPFYEQHGPPNAVCGHQNLPVQETIEILNQHYGEWLEGQWSYDDAFGQDVAIYDAIFRLAEESLYVQLDAEGGAIFHGSDW